MTSVIYLTWKCIAFSVQTDRGPLYSKAYMNYVDDEGTSALHQAVQNDQSKVIV